MIKVLIVDDSPSICSILRRTINKEEDMEVVGSAGDPYQARELILKFKPDVMTVDVEMPKMDGLEFTRFLPLLSLLWHEKIQRLHLMPLKAALSLLFRNRS